MQILKVIVLIVLAIVALVLIIALFLKKDYAIQREALINSSPHNVYDYVRNIRNQDNWSVWVMKDPAMEKHFHGSDGTIGFVYVWNSVKGQAGKGEQEITSLLADKEVNTEIRFEKPMKSVAHTQMTTEATGNRQTKVKWLMKGRWNYPMNIMGLFADKMLGKDMTVSLNNLKNILEKSE